LRCAGAIAGEGVDHPVEPPGNEPQLEPPQGASSLSQIGHGVITVPILPEVNWQELTRA
jgi:hypothetical protein